MTLQALNTLPKGAIENALFQCCGSKRWVAAMLGHFPFQTEHHLFEAASKEWRKLEEKDVLEAFSHHPKIGDLDSLKKKFASTANLALSEQGQVSSASTDVLQRLAILNERYWQKFSFIFIICATGKTAEQMLNAIEKRVSNSRSEEISIAATEQEKITKLRLEKLLLS